MKRFYEYIEKINSGEIVSCNYVKKTIKRAELDLQRPDLYFDEEEVQRVIDFIESLYLLKNKRFILELWQVFVIGCLYGFKWRSTETRKYTQSYIELARKNGKSTFVAAIFLYELVVESNAECYIGANSREQATILFKMVSNMARLIDPKEKFFQRLRSEIKLKNSNSFIKVVSADAKRQDGYNSSAYCVDEYHAAATSDLKDVLRTSQNTRNNPLGIVITTAGFDKTGPCYIYRQHAIEILNNATSLEYSSEDSLGENEFCIIYTLDEGDDWLDEKVWIKANPNLGVTNKWHNFKNEILSAKGFVKDTRNAQVKYLNVWKDFDGVEWVTWDDVESISKKLEFPSDKQMYCGIDLSVSRDITAIAFIWQGDDNKPHLKILYYLPEELVHSHKDRNMYMEWNRQGFLKFTKGNVIDFNDLIEDLSQDNIKRNIKTICYDPFQSSQFAINLSNNGFHIYKFYQSNKQFTLGTTEIERFIKTKDIVIDYNPITFYNFRNVVLSVDRHGNVKPDKSASANKIDGVIAAIQAITPYILSNPNKKKTMPVVIKV